MDLELTRCPACGHPAEIFDRFVVVGDRGAVEHVKIRCITRRDVRAAGRPVDARCVHAVTAPSSAVREADRSTYPAAPGAR